LRITLNTRGKGFMGKAKQEGWRIREGVGQRILTSTRNGMKLTHLGQIVAYGSICFGYPLEFKPNSNTAFNAEQQGYHELSSVHAIVTVWFRCTINPESRETNEGAIQACS
jgi:hypothetical protein